MAGPFTIDASVFINAFNPYEEGHEDSTGCWEPSRGGQSR
jgi:hypothetical protein